MSTRKSDPRHQNVIMDSSSVGAYLKGYAEALRSAIQSVSAEVVEDLARRICDSAELGRQVLVVGNGGSAAIAEHLCCDWTKGTVSSGSPVISSRSLTANSSLYSAIANDFGFEHVFDTQIEFFARPGDLLIAVSSSGNSPNVLNAVSRAKELGVFVAGFSGFSGGKLAEIADASIYVEAHNYGIVEDAHQAVMHIIAQYIAARRDNAKLSA